MTLLGYGKPMEPKPIKNLRQAPSKVSNSIKKFVQFNEFNCVFLQCPPVFDGKHLVVYALLPSGSALPTSATLRATSPVGPLTVKLPLDQSQYESGRLIHRLAAKKLIQELQDKESGRFKKEIIELGCKYRKFFNPIVEKCVIIFVCRAGLALHFLRGCRSQGTDCTERIFDDDAVT